MDPDELFDARTRNREELRAALSAAADLRDQTAQANLEATRACNALALRARMEKALPVEDILNAARISRAWLYSLKPGEGGLSGIKDKPAKAAKPTKAKQPKDTA
jgi:hypothetical protein